MPVGCHGKFLKKITWNRNFPTFLRCWRKNCNRLCIINYASSYARIVQVIDLMVAEVIITLGDLHHCSFSTKLSTKIPINRFRAFSKISHFTVCAFRSSSKSICWTHLKSLSLFIKKRITFGGIFKVNNYERERRRRNRPEEKVLRAVKRFFWCSCCSTPLVMCWGIFFIEHILFLLLVSPLRRLRHCRELNTHNCLAWMLIVYIQRLSDISHSRSSLWIYIFESNLRFYNLDAFWIAMRF